MYVWSMDLGLASKFCSMESGPNLSPRSIFG